MRKFIASMVYDLSQDTPPQARKLLRAELVGRRWKDRVRDRMMPNNAVWIERQMGMEHTTSTIHDLCADELEAAAAAVTRAGLTITVRRAWIQVSGAGSYGLAKDGMFVGG